MARIVTELIGVYHADGGIVGEIQYVVGRMRGTAHCALCDITHGRVRRKPAWDDACSGLPFAVRLVHRNERTTEEAAACTLGTPTVLARYDDGGLEAILGPDDLELGGSVDRFMSVLTQRLDAAAEPEEDATDAVPGR